MGKAQSARQRNATVSCENAQFSGFLSQAARLVVQSKRKLHVRGKSGQRETWRTPLRASKWEETRWQRVSSSTAWERSSRRTWRHTRGHKSANDTQMRVVFDKEPSSLIPPARLDKGITQRDTHTHTDHHHHQSSY